MVIELASRRMVRMRRHIYYVLTGTSSRLKVEEEQSHRQLYQLMVWGLWYTVDQFIDQKVRRVHYSVVLY